MTSNGPATAIPSEVGWQFVPQYYNFVNKEPERLHCFYSKQSVFVHGTEGEEAKTCNGQTEIHAQINSLAFQDCKIFIHSVDAQSSANGGIIIQVIGEMSNQGGPWKKFVQTFFLAEQPNGYFVLNDIFRFLKEDTVDGEEGAESEAAEEQAQDEAQDEVQAEAPATEETAAEPIATQEPEPEPAPAPAVAVAEPTPVAVEEPPTTVADVPEPEPIHEPVAQLNGVHSENDKLSAQAAPTPEKPKSPVPPPMTAAVSAPPTAPSQPSQAPAPTQQAAAPTPAAPPVQPTPQPAQPAAPKTWANLAAANSKKWGSAVAQESRGTTEVLPATPAAPASGSQTPQGTARQGGRSPHPLYQAAQNVTIPHCFIKNVGENVTEPALRQALQRFGSVKQAEIVRSKACAFVEFTSVDAAKRAITASLQPQAGGEGGVKVDVPGEGPVRIIVETKKERGDRPISTRGRGGFEGNRGGEGRGGGPGPNAGGDRGGFRGRGGRGRGGPPK